MHWYPHDRRVNVQDVEQDQDDMLDVIQLINNHLDNWLLNDLVIIIDKHKMNH